MPRGRKISSRLELSNGRRACATPLTVQDPEPNSALARARRVYPTTAWRRAPRRGTRSCEEDIRNAGLQQSFVLGFDHLEWLLDQVSKSSGDGYPPYNIEQVG